MMLYRLSGSAADVARAVELEVFNTCYGDTPELLAESYGPYEASSTFLLAVVGEQPAGVLRYILPSVAGNKTKNDTGHGDFDVSKSCDIGTLALRPEFRGGRQGREIARQLVSVAHSDLLAVGIEHVTAILSPAAFVGLVKLLKMPFEVMGQPFTYLGLPKSRAVYMRLPNARMAEMLGVMPSVQSATLGNEPRYEALAVVPDQDGVQTVGV
jgi:hypothetical protein